MISHLKARRRTIVLWCVALGVVGLVSMLSVAWIAVGRLVAPADHPVGPPPADLAIKLVRIEGESASTVAGWHLAVPGSSATVILLHPLHGDRRAMLTRARILHGAGYSTLLIDLPGHGETQHESLTFGWQSRLAVVDAVRFVRQRDPVHRIGVVGWSLGGASAVLASPLGVEAMVLESVYPTIDQAVHNRIALRAGEAVASVISPLLVGQLPYRLGVSPSDLRPSSQVKWVGCPVLVMAGGQDLRTTKAETQSLFDSAAHPKAMVWFPDVGHVDLQSADPKRWKTSVLPFLADNLSLNASGR